MSRKGCLAPLDELIGASALAGLAADLLGATDAVWQIAAGVTLKRSLRQRAPAPISHNEIDALYRTGITPRATR